MQPSFHDWKLTEDNLGLLNSFKRFFELDKAGAKKHIMAHFCGVSEDLRAMSGIPFKYYHEPIIEAFISLIDYESQLSLSLNERDLWQLRNKLFCGFSPVWEAISISKIVLEQMHEEGVPIVGRLLSKTRSLNDYSRDIDFVRSDLDEVVRMVTRLRPDFEIEGALKNPIF